MGTTNTYMNNSHFNIQQMNNAMKDIYTESSLDNEVNAVREVS